MNVDAITDAVRGVLMGTAGSVRTVTVGRFAEDVHDDTEDGAAWVRGRTGAAGALQAQADIRVGVPRRTGWVGSQAASIGVWVLPLTVVLRYAVPALVDLREDVRYAIRAQAAEDAVEVGLALTWPGNVPSVSVVSDVLHAAGTPTVEREDFGEDAGLYVLAIPFEAWVQETQAVA